MTKKRRTMKIVLILMVRNESKIIERCLKAVETFVDAVCVHDTGSVDNTCELVKEYLKTHKGCLTTSTWKDFGYNRTQSFVEARKFVESNGYDLKQTYGLLLDADMMFEVGSLLSQNLTEVGYTIIQKNGNLEYPNCRLVRMDHPWVCKGVTHEYWDGSTTPLPKTICWIDDWNDGGCKADKFERDARLLEQGLADEPTNVRYMFYLAQTYHCLGRFEDAIRMYKRRIKAGGWFEEQWYSMYMIGQTYLTLKNVPKFEEYMLKAYEFRPTRAESLYKLAKYFRETSQHYKSYHYMRLGVGIPLPSDSLFVETDVYTDLFDYEETVCLYYMDRKREGLRKSMNYLFTKSRHIENVFTNMVFYVEPIGKTYQNHPIPRDVFGRDYHPTSVCSFDGDTQLVRFVNYSITNTGSYDMKEGSYSPYHKVRTQNAIWTPEGRIVRMDDSSISLPRRSCHILGVEDVRVYRDANQTLRFVATSSEYSEKIRIVSGEVGMDGTYKDVCVMDSPFDNDCEKNWIPVNGTNDVIYSWNPLRVGHMEASKLVFDKEIDTPDFFHRLRGSAVPVRIGKELWCLVHYVMYCTPRKYFHCIVVLDADTYTPKRMSLPFVFREEGIEYCLSMVERKNDLEFLFSSWDDNPMTTRVSKDVLEWIQT